MKKEDINLDLNLVRNSRNETLLMLAASGTRRIHNGQSYETVALLLKNDADPLLTSNDGRTALMEAANFCRASVVKLLIDSVSPDRQVAYINQKDDAGITAKQYAGQLGHFTTKHEQINKVLDEFIQQAQLGNNRITNKR